MKKKYLSYLGLLGLIGLLGIPTRNYTFFAFFLFFIFFYFIGKEDQISIYTKNKYVNILLAISLILIVLASTFVVALSTIGYYLFHDSLESGYEYELMLFSNNSLQDFEIYVPTVHINDTYNNNYTIDSETTNWQVNNTIKNNVTMLSVNNTIAEAINKTNYYGDEFMDLSLQVRSHIETEKFVNTIDPTENELLLEPRSNIEQIECQNVFSDQKTCYQYETKINLNWETEDNTQTDIIIRNDGYNTWWTFGWDRDYYREVIEITDLNGSQSGWQEVNATLITGSDNYPF